MATAALTSSGVGLVETAEDARLCALKLSAGQRDLAELIEGSHTTVAACGRQSGKTTLAAVTAVWNLLLRPDLDRLAGRSARFAISIANSKEQASILLSFVREFAEHSPLLRRRIEQLRDDRIVFSGGRVLVAAPCTDRLTRGLRASLLVMDEAAHFVSDSWGPRTAEKIFSALRPSLVTFGQDGKAIVASTPGSDWFAHLFAQAQAGELPGAATFSAPTATMNPTVSPEFLAGEEALLGPADFAREFLAQFVGGSAAFLDSDDLRDCVGRFRELPPDDVTDAVVGFDPAFANDPSAWVVVGRSREDRKRLLVCRVGRWAPTRSRSARRAAKTEAQVREVRDAVLDSVAELAKQYGASVVSDSHLARVVQDGLAERGISRVHIEAWNGRTLVAAFSALRARVVAGTIELPQDDVLLGELVKVRSRTKGGASAVEVPRTTASHLDSALALAAAVLFLDKRGALRPSRFLSSFRQTGHVEQSTAPGRARVYSAIGQAEPSERELEAIGRMLGLR